MNQCIQRACLVGAAVLALLVILLSASCHADKYIVQASVAPRRIMLVDKKGNITEIISNTAERVRPIALQAGNPHKKMMISKALEAQYNLVIEHHDFSRPRHVRVKIYRILKWNIASIKTVETTHPISWTPDN